MKKTPDTTIENGFSVEAINLQTRRILDHPLFRSSPTLSNFLEFIITETVQERNQQIKEYSIAVNVLNRSHDFNPHDDAVVRIHAGRLRRALSEYYFTQGINDPIVIQIPKGSYVPQFSMPVKSVPDPVADSTTVEVMSNPSVAVFPFRTLANCSEARAFSELIREQLCAELSRFRDISVIGYYSMEMMTSIEQNIVAAGKTLGVDYIITGSLYRIEQHSRIRINILMARTGEILMTRTFETETGWMGSPVIQDEIIEGLVSALGGHDGLFSREMHQASPIKVCANAATRESISNYYKLQRSFTVDNYKRAFYALNEVAKVFPDNATVLAMLAELCVCSLPTGIKNAGDPLSKAADCITRSLEIDPRCQHAWRSLSLLHLCRGDKEACLSASLHCVELNPNHPAVVSGIGVFLIGAGYFEEGYLLLKRVSKMDPNHPSWTNTGFALYYLYKKDYDSAWIWAKKMNSEDIYLDSLLKAVVLAYLDKTDEAKNYLLQLMILKPETGFQLRNDLSRFLLSEELVDNIMHGLGSIGFQHAKLKAVRKAG